MKAFDNTFSLSLSTAALPPGGHEGTAGVSVAAVDLGGGGPLGGVGRDITGYPVQPPARSRKISFKAIQPLLKSLQRRSFHHTPGQSVPLLNSSHSDCLQNIIGLKGKDALLAPVVIGTPTYITWKKEENIVHEWNGTSDHSNGNLIIKNVSHSDDGLYTAEIQMGTKLEYCHFCLKILEYLEPPVLYCSDHSDDIQVNCASPPQNYSHNLPVSYHWEHTGEVIDHGLQSIKLSKNEGLPEKITCIIHIYNVHASSSIALTECLSIESDQGRSRPALIGVFGVLVIVLLVFGLWKKDRLTHWLNTRKQKRQEDPGNADVPLNEMLTDNGPRCVSEDLKDNRSEDTGDDVPLNETPDDSKCVLENSKDDRREGNADVPLNEMLTDNGPRCVSEDLKDNRSEDTGDDVPLNETPDDSKCVLENSKDDRREGNAEDVPLNETPDDSKCVLENSKDDRREGNSTTAKA
ncbi:uncharacterized protein LOC100564742 isoform X3 [Anolis carolinensis]|uniref:uncharacterized protein LOC100564742 isoform X3 n=1 Tax=Anolis carolinensis TaxID=28377 RepID=UPI002F2B843B